MKKKQYQEFEGKGKVDERLLSQNKPREKREKQEETTHINSVYDFLLSGYEIKVFELQEMQSDPSLPVLPFRKSCFTEASLGTKRWVGYEDSLGCLPFKLSTSPPGSTWDDGLVSSPSSESSIAKNSSKWRVSWCLLPLLTPLPWDLEVGSKFDEMGGRVT